jgi:hypothetical protein
VWKCVPYYCHRVSTQLQLKNIYHIKTLKNLYYYRSHQKLTARYIHDSKKLPRIYKLLQPHLRYLGSILYGILLFCLYFIFFVLFIFLFCLYFIFLFCLHFILFVLFIFYIFCFVYIFYFVYILYFLFSLYFIFLHLILH